MKLSQKELEVIRLERIGEYKKRIQKHLESNSPYFAVNSFCTDIKDIADSIHEIETELTKKHPTWDDIPF